jgi:hypothetical protein
MAEVLLYKIARIDDKTLGVLLDQFAARYQLQSAAAVVLGSSVSVGAAGLAQSPRWSEIVTLGGELVSNLTFHASDTSITYMRGGRAEPRSPYFDELSVRRKDGLDGTEVIGLIGALQQIFLPARTQWADEDPKSASLATHESTLLNLQRLTQTLVEETHAYRIRLDEAADERRLQLEKGHADKTKALEDEIASQRAEVGAREKLLAEEKSKLDDRDNTHARRDTRERILNDVQRRISQFGVSAATERKRTPVALGMMALGVVFALLLVSSLWELTQLASVARTAGPGVAPTAPTSEWFQSPSVWLWLRAFIASFGLVATLLYYVKWQNAWAAHHADREFNLQQFHLDVNRANWIMESCLEWRKETKSPIPTELLTSITRGLFTNAGETNSLVLHPADELASALLGTASKLNLDIGGNKIEIDKPGKIPQSITAGAQKA